MPTAVKTYAGEQSLGHKDVEPPYDFHEGDVVVYHPVGGSQVTTVGLVRDVLQEPDIVGEGRAVTVKATEEDPRFVCLTCCIFTSLTLTLISRSLRTCTQGRRLPIVVPPFYD